MVNLQSTINKIGQIVTQIIHFSNGNKRTIEHIIVASIKQGEFTKFRTTDNRMWLINTKNVDCLEVFKEE